MKKILLLCFLLSLSAQLVMAQPTQAEIDKMIKDAQAEIDKLKKDPKTAEMAKGLPNLENITKIIPTGNNQEVLKNLNKNSSSTALPVRNNKLLGSLPKKNLSRQELVSFLSLLYADMLKKLPAAKVKSAQAIISQLNKDVAQIATTGVMAWYKNAPYESALLLVYAASQSPDDNTLNNCGAILNLCGLEDKAIPLLKYALAHQPTNSTVLNNLGQAYTGLGAIDTAMYYLMGCIRQNATHPEACATVAYIEYEKGNIEKAQQMAEQAIKGGYSSDLAKFYKGIKKDAKLFPLLQNRLSEKKLFDFNGFAIPPNCRSWEESEEVYAQQEAFRKKIDALTKQFKQLVIQNTPTDIASVNAVNWKEGPFSKLAQALKDGLMDLYSEEKTVAHMDYMEKLTRTIQGQHDEEMAVNNKYVPLFKAAEKNPPMIARLIHEKCLDDVIVDNKWFEFRANLAERYKNAWLERDIRSYSNTVFLTTMTAPNENIFKAESATYASFLLTTFNNYVLDNCNPLHKPDCSKSDPAKEKDTNSPIFEVANCPIDIELPMIIGKIKLNCTRIEIEGGEGVIFTYEKNFISRETTLAIGFGVATEIPYIEFGAKEQLFIKFDKNNQPTDIGLLVEAEFDVKGLATPEIKSGFSLGVNSGFAHQPGILEGFTTERQMNNNVNIYTPAPKQD